MFRKYCIRILLCLAAILLALKFGSFVGNGEQAMLPVDLTECIIFVGWPDFLAAACGGILLLAVIIAYPHVRFTRNALAPFFWSLTLVAGIIGLLNTTEMDYAWQWLLHFTGALCFCTAIWWAACNDDGFLETLCGVIAVLGVIAAVHGWYQHFIGLDDKLQMTIEVAKQQGVEISEMMLQKMAQTRVYGVFTDPNVYASHIIFCAPFALYFLYRLGLGLEGNPKAGALIFSGIGAVLFLAALYWSGSRGAMIGTALAICAVVWALPAVRSWRWRWCLPVLAIILGVAMIFAVSMLKSRDGMASASERMFYYKTALRMFAQHPFAGVGLGEFFPWYLKLKPLEAEVTRDPHNIFLSFLSQTGIFGGIVILLLYFMPWVAATFMKFKKDEQVLAIASIGATVAWMTHSLFQFNELIPGTMYFATIGGLFFLQSDNDDAEKNVSLRVQIPMHITAAVCGLLACAGLLRIPGEILLRQGETAEKQKPGNGAVYFLEAGKKLSYATMPWRCLGDIYSKQGNWESAHKANVELSSLIPHRASAYFRLACTHIVAGRLEEASIALEKTAEWYPYYPEMLVAKAILEYRQSHANASYMQIMSLVQQALSLESEIARDGNEIVVSFNDNNKRALAELLKDYTIVSYDGSTVRFLPSSVEK